MTKIKNYSLDETLSAGDKWVGTDADDNNQTKNYTLGDVTQYVIDAVGAGYVDTNARILVTKKTAGAIIDGQGVASDNPAKAINRSFKGAISVSKYEILLFEIHRQVLVPTVSGEKFKLLKEQYYYRKGEGTINADLDEVNWEDELCLDYSVELTATVTGTTKGSAAETATLTSGDTSNPAASINAYTTVVALDNTSKNQYIALYSPTDELDYKFYIYSGPVGNFGSGGDTAVPGDFTEITQVEETTKTKLSDFINDGDGSNAFATTDTVPANTSDLINDGDGVSNFAVLTDLPANTSDLINDGDGVSNFAVLTDLPAKTSDLINDGNGTGVFVEETDLGVSSQGFPYLRSFKVTVSAAAMRSGKSSPIQVAAAPGVGYAWKLVDSSAASLTWGSVAFDGGGNLWLITDGAIASSEAYQGRYAPQFLSATSNRFSIGDDKAGSTATSPAIIENARFMLEAEFDSTVGDSVTVFYITLRAIEL